MIGDIDPNIQNPRFGQKQVSLDCFPGTAKEIGKQSVDGPFHDTLVLQYFTFASLAPMTSSKPVLIDWRFVGVQNQPVEVSDSVPLNNASYLLAL